MASRGGRVRSALLDLLGEEVVHRPLFRVALLVRDEALDERAIALGIERRVEPHLGGVERGERLHHIEREPGDIGDLLGRGLAAQLLAERSRRCG